jgi:hypothetical protein
VGATVKKIFIVVAVVLSLSLSSIAFAENSTSGDVSNELKDIKLRLDSIEKKNQVLEEKNLDLETKNVEQQAKDEKAMKFSGMAYLRYEWNNGPHSFNPALGNYFAGSPTGKTNTRMLYYFNVDQEIDDKSYIHAMLGGEGASGYYSDHYLGSAAQFYEASYGSKAGNVDWEVGRMTAHVGLGTVFCGGYADGIRLGFGDKIKTRLYWVNQGAFSWLMGDATTALNKDTSVTLSFAKSSVVGPFAANDMYNTKAIGLEYKGLPNVAMTGEYGMNTAAYGKSLNNSSKTHAYFVKAKYKGANPLVPGTGGAFIAYVNGQRGYDPYIMAGDHKSFDLETAYNFTFPSGGFFIDNTRGFVGGIETTVAKNAVVYVSYGVTKAVSDDAARTVTQGMKNEYLISRVAWFF